MYRHRGIRWNNTARTSLMSHKAIDVRALKCDILDFDFSVHCAVNVVIFYA